MKSFFCLNKYKVIVLTFFILLFLYEMSVGAMFGFDTLTSIIVVIFLLYLLICTMFFAFTGTSNLIISLAIILIGAGALWAWNYRYDQSRHSALSECKKSLGINTITKEIMDCMSDKGVKIKFNR